MDGDFVRNRLFQPFASTKSGGFGIGLVSKARALLTAMGGRLSVDSRRGFARHHLLTILLPTAAEASASRHRNENRMTDFADLPRPRC